MKRLIKEMLETYTARDLSPWHMPGHKRRCVLGGMWDDLFRLDVTEVPGTDDLHHAVGPILESERAAAEAVGAKYAHYLVGGSTAGILASIAAAAKLWRERMSDSTEASSDHDPGSSPLFLVAGNCHKSVWNGIRLAGAGCIPLEPEGDPVYGPVAADTLLHVLAEVVEDSTQVAGCIVTSPTYAGSISSLGELHAVLQVYGIPLIVDEAHGAHLPFCEELSWYSGIHAGAEYVVASLHKTLPALTQTAVLYVGGAALQSEEKETGSEDAASTERESTGEGAAAERDPMEGSAPEEEPFLSAERLERAVAGQLAVFQSSSPSYILMLSAEEALAWADENRERFDAYIPRIRAFREEMAEILKWLEPVPLPGVQDPTRLMLRCRKADTCTMTGVEMAAWLEEKAGIVVELAGSREIILISTVCDEEEDLQHLKEGLLQLDQVIAAREESDPQFELREIPSLEEPEAAGFHGDDEHDAAHGDDKEDDENNGAHGDDKGDDDDEANAPTEVLCKEAAVSEEKLPRVGDFVQRDIYVYPPGVPVLRAGERVTEDALRRLREEEAAGRRVYGL